MHHKHHEGLGCSCCSPIWRHLIPSTLLGELVRANAPIPKNSQSQPLIFAVDPESPGTIQTIAGGENNEVEAIGIADGKVAITGTLGEVSQRLPGADIRYVKGSETLLPGFVEPHVHILPTAQLSTTIKVNPFDGQNLRAGYDRDWVFQILKKNLNTPWDGWIVATGMDPSLFEAGERKMDNLVLDKEVSATLPICIFNASLHTAYVNSCALQRVFSDSIPEHAQDGVLQEMGQMSAVIAKLPRISSEDLDQEVDNVFANASENGITYLHDAGIELTHSDNEPVTSQVDYLIKKADNAEVRLGGAIWVQNDSDLNKVFDSWPKPDNIQNFNLSFIKLVSDGSNQGLTGSQHTAYQCDDEYQADSNSGNFGHFNYDPPSEFNAMVKRVSDQGWSVMIHANGDHAVDLTIDAYRAVDSVPALRRDRIEHASLLSDQNLCDMKTLGISPSFLIGHVGYWGDVFQQTIFGASRTNRLDRCQSALNEGLKISLHSDTGVTPLGPLRMMEQAITRVMEGVSANDPDAAPKILNEQEQLSRFAALKAVTYDAAWQCRMEQSIGSLEVGKCADLVLLEQSPLNYGADDGALGAIGMRDIRVLATYKAGCQTYCELTRA